MNVIFGKYLIVTAVWVQVLWGCERKGMPETSPLPAQQRVTLSVEGYGYADSAEVFFFREWAGRDSLFEQRTVYKIGNTPQPCDFCLPPGDYMMKIVGNVPTELIVARPPFSSDSIFVDYEGINNIPAVYYGSRRFNVGVDSAGGSALLLFTCAVELTLREIPVGVERIQVEVLHTAAGITLSGNVLPERNPPVSVVLGDVRADSTYIVELSTFPNPKGITGSIIRVQCYGEGGREIYSGSSVSFPSQMGRRRVVACSFRRPLLVRNGGRGNNQIYWEYNEDDL